LALACLASISGGFSTLLKHFWLFYCSKIEGWGNREGRGGGEERKLFAANPTILKKAPLALSRMIEFIT